VRLAGALRHSWPPLPGRLTLLLPGDGTFCVGTRHKFSCMATQPFPPH
jgi:hypothetical protein